MILTHSSRRVLTTEWLSGETLEAVGIEDEVARRRYAEGLWKFVFRSLLVGGAFNADPHPGNYFFQPDGKIAFLDFGCVQLMPDHARQAALSAHRGAAVGDLGGFREGMTELLQLRAGSYRDATLEYVELCFQPIFQSPFRITRTWAGDLTKLAQELKSVMLERGANLTLPPPHLAMMNRLQFGFYSVLARLDVEVDYRAIEARVLSEAAEVDSGEIRRLLV